MTKVPSKVTRNQLAAKQRPYTLWPGSVLRRVSVDVLGCEWSLLLNTRRFRLHGLPNNISCFCKTTSSTTMRYTTEEKGKWKTTETAQSLLGHSVEAFVPSELPERAPLGSGSAHQGGYEGAGPAFCQPISSSFSATKARTTRALKKTCSKRHSRLFSEGDMS